MTERYYSSTAVTTALSTGVDDSTGSITVDETTGFPTQFPYTLVIDINTSDEELVDVTSAAGNTLTVTRGVDGTVGIAHEAGATVRHTVTGRDLQDSRDHEESDSGVHGLDGGDAVVGETTAATLEGKTIDGGDNTLQNVPQSAITDLVDDQSTQDSDISTNAGNISSLTSTVSTHESSSNVHGVGEVLGRTEAQTVTNKSMNGDNNTFSNIGQGSIKRAILSMRGIGGSENVPQGSENTGTTVEIVVNIGGFQRGAFTSDQIVPYDGVYWISWRCNAHGEGNIDVSARVRRNGGNDQLQGDIILSDRVEIGANNLASNHDRRANPHATGIVVLNAGDRLKFNLRNWEDPTVTWSMDPEDRRIDVIYLGPDS